MEVPRISPAPQLLAAQQGRNDESDGAEDGENGVVPGEAVEAEEEARDAAGGGFGLDLRRVLGDLVDSFEDRGAAGSDGFAGDGGVPVAAVLWVVLALSNSRVET